MDDPEQTRLFSLLAARLKEAHAYAHHIDAPPEVRASLVRRLLKITHLARRDPADALARLTCLLAELRQTAPGALNRTNRPDSLHPKGD